ncbi:MAG: indole-3-glycerol-phosphate synthase [Chitinivibrionales bacterium]|nr:indole-3-glycerol-phosphate synthase [Chitinivibrionales bacterium]
MNILDSIVTQRKERVDRCRVVVPQSSLHRDCASPIRFFREAGQITLIAECKKASPSRGIMVADADYFPANIAAEYIQGGADCLSIITEPDFFQGSDDHLRAVRDTTATPILRKDFIVHEYQVHESWALGADAILLIAAILSPQQCADYSACARSLGMSTLLEVHDAAEIELVLAHGVGVDAIGVNSRNLKDFSIDRNGAAALRRMITPGTCAVAESGLHAPADGVAMYQAGFQGFLVGEYFVTSANRQKTVRQFKDAILTAQSYKESSNIRSGR